MLIELAVIVLLAAIVVFFSREFAAYIKKILAIPAVGLILPISIASLLVVWFHYWVLWVLLTLKFKLKGLYTALAAFMTFPGGNYLAAIILLMAFSVLPVTLANLYCLRSTYREFPYTWITSALLWIFVLVLLVF